MKPDEPEVNYRKRIYERYASRFQDATMQFDTEASARWGRAYRYYFRKWFPRSKEARIADLACGGGKLLHFFNKQGFSNIEGVDLSPEQVALARQTGVQVEEGNAIDYLEAHPDTFDLITALDLIEHFHKPEVLRFLDACHGALRPGGRLILQTPNAESPWGSLHRYNDFTHEVGFNPNALSRLLRLVNFESIEARELGPVPWGYSAASTLRWFVWQSIRQGLKIWNLAETGASGSGVFSRVFLISGIKK
jgi:2-polyprenyl-3-methyl-5-hydroxy-6-metoxy-1,4-benzoquinol methylase